MRTSKYFLKVFANFAHSFPAALDHGEVVPSLASGTCAEASRSDGGLQHHSSGL